MLPAIGATCFPEKSGDSEEASFFSVHQHIHPPSIYLYIYLSIRMSTHASICPSTHHPPIHSSTYLLTHLPTFPSIHPSIYPSTPTSLHLPIYLAVHQFIYVSTHLSSILHSLAHPSVHQSISSPVHSSINLPTINSSILPLLSIYPSPTSPSTNPMYSLNHPCQIEKSGSLVRINKHLTLTFRTSVSSRLPLGFHYAHGSTQRRKKLTGISSQHC